MEFVLTECITHILGVMIDDKLNWKEHIKIIQSKISKTTAIIYNIKQVTYSPKGVCIYYTTQVH